MSRLVSDRMIDAQFGLELAGEPVAWVGAFPNNHPDNPASVTINFSCSVVGENGATYSFYRDQKTGSPLFTTGDSVGFKDVAEIRMVANWENPYGMPYVESQLAPRFANVLKSFGQDPNAVGTRFMHGGRPSSETGIWLIGKDSILSGVKGVLAAESASYAYPALYYTFALIAEDPTILADPKMKHITTAELGLAKAYYEALTAAEVSGAAVARRLGESAPNTAAANARVFKDQRLELIALEADASLAISAMAARSARLYTPVEGGRTWPYMDHTDYERELRMLGQGNTGTPLRELTKEQAALTRRREFAFENFRRMQALRVVEWAIGEPEANA